MTVRELIDRLQTLDKDLTVYFTDGLVDFELENIIPPSEFYPDGYYLTAKEKEER